MSSFFPPAAVKGMTEFNADAFSKDVELPFIRIPTQSVNKVIGAKAIQTHTLRAIGRLKKVCDGDNNTEKLIFLDPDSIDPATSEEVKSVVKKILDMDVNIEYKMLNLKYEDWDAKRCIRAVLPDDLDFSGYSTIGHILHANVRDNIMPYRFVLGRILLDKIGYIRTVVNKLDMINSEFRFFEIELLAGEPDYVAVVSENKLKFKLDFSKVFWNSRLSTEHQRVVQDICRSPNSVIIDAFAGVGPFVIPASFRKVVLKAYANDLNPESVKYLRENVEMNKVPNGKIKTYNMDAGDFITDVVPTIIKESIAKAAKEPSNFHVVMNLPALAYTFLSKFKGILDSSFEWPENPPNFYIYCHLFVKSSEDRPRSWFEEKAVSTVLEQFSCQPKVLENHFVRVVSGNKEMFCVKLQLPLEYLISSAELSDERIPEKRRKLESA